MAAFFIWCSIIGENIEEIEDLLLHRYSGNIDYVMKQHPDDAVRLIKKAIEKDNEDKIWDLYVAKSIIAGKELPPFDEVIKDAKEYSKNQVVSKVSTWEEAEFISEKAFNAFKKS